ncbi:MAG: ROK family protein [Pyrinomonadaceae bacterium]
MPNEIIAGIDIGGTKIALALETIDGARISSRNFPTQVELGPCLIFEKIVAAVKEMVQESGASLAALGVGCPGPLDFERGWVMSPTNLPGWDKFPIVSLLEERLGVLTALDNDANAAALGEHVHGAGLGFSDMVYITISTGIGGGIICNGQLVHGVSAGAGEIGHTTVLPDGPVCGCGARGCLEALGSGTALARRARELMANGEQSIISTMVNSPDEITARIIAEAAKCNDKLAREVWDEMIYFLSIGIGNVITTLAPEAVILGGGVAMSGEQLLGPLRPLIRERVRMLPVEQVQILQAALGDESGILGALVIARSALSAKSASVRMGH